MTQWIKPSQPASTKWTGQTPSSYPAPTYSNFNLLQEDGSKILQQNSSKIQIQLVNPQGFQPVNNPPVTVWH